MTPDPQEPETFQNTSDDQTGVEVPEADAAEQRTELTPDEDTAVDERTTDHANPADAAEQARSVATGEDEYR
ncbi:hypothetical protein SRB5_69080 [Streptomyces sp. RB5]|uniref:Uncharacterized protein n=1 Tax=Streptomyces smaragdinus TaxID=2585196 RepID=A0A7K0CT87_9ACTN|nr:hypothetical protein [Streptomyces smaragdinus]MQY16706.1 hypothetical protein [Streptomyces smaragdinus]